MTRLLSGTHLIFEELKGVVSLSDLSPVGAGVAVRPCGGRWDRNVAG